MPPISHVSIVTLIFPILFTYPTLAAYTIQDNFSGSNFLSGFNFFSGSDPTHGWVRYLTETDARAQDLVSASRDTTYIGVDYKNIAPNGRASVRLESKKLYQKGLFVLDLAHMPASTCGTWPSFWTWGAEAKWPELGEIDIIEGIHTNTINAMSLHTADGCSIDGKGSQGNPQTPNCYITAPGQTSNAGCAISSSSSASFGTPFNANGGGIFATEWTSTFIKMWFFPRSSIPADLKSGSGTVDPSRWGMPDASFQGLCDFNERFGNQRIVLDTTFCGDWGGAVWDACKVVASSCNSYVANNPAVFSESYWRVNYLKIFKQV